MCYKRLYYNQEENNRATHQAPSSNTKKEHGERKEKNMKKIETLVKEAEKMSFEEFMQFFTLDEAKEYYEYLTEETFKQEISLNQLFALAIYRELAKSLNVKSKDKKETFKLELDANYEKSKMHDSAKYLVDYFSLVTSDRDRAIQMYLTCNAKKGEAYFRYCTSCKKVTREQFESLEDELHFTVKRDSKTNRAKTSERTKISYNEAVEVAKLVLAVLNSELATEAESEDQETA